MPPLVQCKQDSSRIATSTAETCRYRNTLGDFNTHTPGIGTVLQEMFRSAYRQILTGIQCRYVTDDLDTPVFGESQAESIAQVNGLHDRCQCVIAICALSQYIEREIDLGICPDEAKAARNLCLLCVTHECIVHRNRGLVKFICLFSCLNEKNSQ